MINEGHRYRNDYCIDIENGVETARLVDQDRLLNRLMGLFPVSPTALFGTGICIRDRVLDLACGPGGWALEVAYAHPDVEVIGVDVARTMIAYAAAHAQVQDRQNVSFEELDITRPLPFADGSYTYIHARFLAGFLRPTQWMPVLRECRRVLAPGGTLSLTESEWAVTTSTAYEALKRLVSTVLWRANQSLSVDGQSLGVTARLAAFLREVGYQDIRHRTDALEWSFGTPLYEVSSMQCELLFALLRPCVLTKGAVTEEGYQALYEHLLTEMRMPDFCAVASPLTVWGTAPS